MIAIVISKSDIADPFGPRRIDPRLQKRLSVALDPMALWMTVVIGDKNWSGGVVECWSAVQFITPLLYSSRRGHELLPGTQFRIFGEENFDTVNPTGLQFASGDRFVVNDFFAWIDREIGDFLRESAVLRPSSQDLSGRTKQMNIDSL